MLTNKDLHDEINKISKTIETVKDPVEAAKLKGMTLILKLLHSVRTNQVAIMEKLGAEKVKPAKRNPDGTVETQANAQ